MQRMKLKITASLTAVGILLAGQSALASSATAWTQSAKLYEVRTWTGKAELGHANGTPAAATFYHPKSAVALPDGRLLVSDSSNHMLRIVTADQVSAYAGYWLGEDGANRPIGSYNDDVLAKAAFDTPAGLAVDAQGNAYVADTANHAVRKIGKDSKVSTLAGNGILGSGDGTGDQAQFYAPSDVAVDSQGIVYVADTLNHLIRKISPDGKVSTLNAPSDRIIEYVPGAIETAGDFRDGTIASAKFNEPSGLAVDANDNLYVSDRGNQRIRYIDFAANKVTTVAGGGAYADKNAYFVAGDYADGPAAQARLNSPEGLAVAPDGTVVFADSLNHAVRLLKDGKVSTLAGVPVEPGASDGVTGSAQFNHPTDVTILKDGRLVIVDEFGNKVRVLQKYAKPSSLPADKGIAVVFNGALVKTEVPAQAKSNAVLLPLRDVGKALGYKVGYDKKTGNALLSKGDTAYAIAAGSASVTKTSGGASSKLTLNAKALSIDGRLLIPVRFFADESGLDVQWDAESKVVVIRDRTFL